MEGEGLKADPIPPLRSGEEADEVGVGIDEACTGVRWLEDDDDDDKRSGFDHEAFTLSRHNGGEGPGGIRTGAVLLLAPRTIPPPPPPPPPCPGEDDEEEAVLPNDREVIVEGPSLPLHECDPSGTPTRVVGQGWHDTLPMRGWRSVLAMADEDVRGSGGSPFSGDATPTRGESSPAGWRGRGASLASDDRIGSGREGGGRTASCEARLQWRSPSASTMRVGSSATPRIAAGALCRTGGEKGE